MGAQYRRYSCCPKDQIKDVQLVHLAPQSVGGNHKHPRREWFIGIGKLEFIWLDEHGETHSELMNPEGKILLFEVPPFLPHAVRNASSTEFGLLYEMADAKLNKVLKVAVYSVI